MAVSFLRVLWRSAWTGVLGLVGLLLILLLAWVASNWSDEPPTPTPALLELGPPKAGSKFFFEMQGMLAPPGASAEETGRKDWRRLASVPPPDLSASAPEMAGRLPPIQGLPLNCRPPDDCVKALVTGPDRVAAQLQLLSLLGQRCAASLSELRYEEARHEPLTMATTLPSFQGVAQCGLWFKGQAVLAAVRGDQTAARANLDHARRMADAVLGGSQFLIGKMVGAAVARSQFDAVAAVATLQPGWAASLTPPPLPPGASDGATWVAFEAAYIRGTIELARRDCRGGLSQLLYTDEASLGPLAGAACRWGLGFLPNATARQADAQWLHLWTRARQGLEAALEPTPAAAASAATSPKAGGLAWRNTIGQWVLDIGLPATAPYHAKQADVELHRQTLALALATLAQQVPAAERSAWLDRQGLPPRTRQRLSWSEAGAVLVARPWLADLPGNDPRRADIRIAAALP